MLGVALFAPPCDAFSVPGAYPVFLIANVSFLSVFVLSSLFLLISLSLSLSRAL